LVARVAAGRFVALAALQRRLVDSQARRFLPSLRATTIVASTATAAQGGGNLPTRGEERAIDDVDVGPPGGRHRDRGRRATEGADDADGDDEDIGEALSANIDAALDLIALRAA
jgi:hypothetical protein